MCQLLEHCVAVDENVRATFVSLRLTQQHQDVAVLVAFAIRVAVVELVLCRHEARRLLRGALGQDVRAPDPPWQLIARDLERIR